VQGGWLWIYRYLQQPRLERVISHIKAREMMVTPNWYWLGGLVNSVLLLRAAEEGAVGLAVFLGCGRVSMYRGKCEVVENTISDCDNSLDSGHLPSCNSF
jgi:hypothetical protein